MCQHLTKNFILVNKGRKGKQKAFGQNVSKRVSKKQEAAKTLRRLWKLHRLKKMDAYMRAVQTEKTVRSIKKEDQETV